MTKDQVQAAASNNSKSGNRAKRERSFLPMSIIMFLLVFYPFQMASALTSEPVVSSQPFFLPLIYKQAPPGPNHKRLESGNSSTCAITPGGGVKCWGYLAGGLSKTSPVPMQVPGLNSGVISLASGYDFTCALTAAGGVKCWGRNDYGQLGSGTIVNSSIPVDVFGLQSGVAALAAGFHNACVVMQDGTALCWGAWEDSPMIHTRPQMVAGLPPNIASVAMPSDGAARCFLGAGKITCLGKMYVDNTHDVGSLTPWDIGEVPSDVRSIELGGWGEHFCYLTFQGNLYCLDHQASVDTGSAVFRQIPAFDRSAAAVSVGGQGFACGLTSNGGVKCWGSNTWGNLGDGSTTTRDLPADVIGLNTGVAEISSGATHACAMLTNGAVKCWGDNSLGQLGNGQFNFATSIPVDVAQFP